MCASDCHDGVAHPAQFFCLECGEDYCEQEATLHRRSKALRTHTLVPVAEKGRVVSTMCPVHPDEKLKSYCSACAIPICVLCVAETHTAGTLVNPDGPADGPKHKAISLDQAGRAADASLQQIHATVSGLATTYGASVSAVQVCSSQVDSQPSRLSTIYFFNMFLTGHYARCQWQPRHDRSGRQCCLWRGSTACVYPSCLSVLLWYSFHERFYFRLSFQIAAAVQAAHQRVLKEVEAAHATKHAALASLDRDARAHQTQLTAVATRATEAQRQPNLQVSHF